MPGTSNNNNIQSHKSPQSSKRISFLENPYKFEERHALLSEPFKPVVRHAPLSQPHYEPIYKKYPSFQQGLNRTRHTRQNQNTSTIDRQIIQPRSNRNSTTPRVHFIIPSSPIPNPLDLSSSTNQSTPPPLQFTSQQNTLNIPSDYLGSTPISEPFRENPPFNLPTSTQRLSHRMTQAFTQGEPNLVTDPIEISSDTSWSIPETLSVPSTPSLSQTPTTSFPPKFPAKFRR